MSCGAVPHRLSAYLDGELSLVEAGSVSSHLAACVACARRLASLRSALASLADLPRLEAAEPIASRVFDRLEVETQGPGLALLFRSAWVARPLIVPSLLPAAVVLLSMLALVLSLGDAPAWLPGSSPWDAWAGGLPPSGTEANPLFPSAEVGMPRLRTADAVPEGLLEQMSVGTLFLETVVARDGSVSTVTLLEGDSERAAPLLEALRRERFEPVRVRGRPVAVSVYRLISCMEVRSPAT